MQCALCVLCTKKEESKKKKISRLPTGEIKKIIASTIKEYRMRDSYQFRVFNSFMLRQTIKKRGSEREGEEGKNSQSGMQWQSVIKMKVNVKQKKKNERKKAQKKSTKKKGMHLRGSLALIL